MLPSFHRGQKIVYSQLQRFSLLVAGRRWRKTTFGASVLARQAWVNRGEYLWTSPTHDQNKIALGYLEKIYGKRASINRSSMTVTLMNDSIIYLRSLHKPDNVRGFTINGLVIDEAAYTNPDGWTEVLRPTLMDTKGWALKITTPAGFNWIYDEYSSTRDGLISWNIPSYGVGVNLEENTLYRKEHKLENPILDMEEMDSLFSTMDSMSFRQEILAEFIADNLCPFTNIDEICTLKPKRHSSVKTVAGIDFAKSVDYSAISIIDPQTREEILLRRLPQTSYKEQIRLIVDLIKQYKIERICFDATGVGQAIAEMLYDAVYSLNVGLDEFKYTNSSKLDLIYDLVAAFEKRQIKMTDIDIGIYELRKFRRVASGNTVKFENEQAKDHDDTVNARALAYRMVKLGGVIL